MNEDKYIAHYNGLNGKFEVLDPTDTDRWGEFKNVLHKCKTQAEATELAAVENAHYRRIKEIKRRFANAK